MELEDIDHDDEDDNLPPSPFSFHADAAVILTPCQTFNSLEQLTTKWETKLRQFLSVNQFLIHEMRDSISAVISRSSKQVMVDFNVISSARKAYQTATVQSKADILKRKRAGEEKYRQSLQHQVNESKSNKLADAERDRLEGVSNLAFNARKDEEHENARIKFRQKYFPTSLPEQVPRPGESQVAVTQDEESQEEEDPMILLSSQPKVREDTFRMDSPVPVRKLLGTHLKGPLEKMSAAEARKGGVPWPCPMSKTRDVDDVDSAGPASSRIKSGVITTRKRNYNKKVERTIEEILAFRQEQPVEVPTGLIFEEGEVKLNPDNLILTKSKPIPKFNPQIFHRK